MRGASVISDHGVNNNSIKNNVLENYPSEKECKLRNFKSHFSEPSNTINLVIVETQLLINKFSQN